MGALSQGNSTMWRLKRKIYLVANTSYISKVVLCDKTLKNSEPCSLQSYPLLNFNSESVAYPEGGQNIRYIQCCNMLCKLPLPTRVIQDGQSNVEA